MKKVIEFFKGIRKSWRAAKGTSTYYLAAFLFYTMIMISTFVGIFTNTEPSRFDFIIYALVAALFFSTEAIESFSKFYLLKAKKEYTDTMQDREQRLRVLGSTVSSNPDMTKEFLEKNGMSVDEWVEKGLEEMKKIDESIKNIHKLTRPQPKSDNKLD